MEGLCVWTAVSAIRNCLLIRVFLIHTDVLNPLNDNGYVNYIYRFIPYRAANRVTLGIKTNLFI